MKLLIAGSNGQLGQDFQKTCHDSSIEYIATGSKDLDVTNLSAIRQFITLYKVDVIINCAAYNAVDLAEVEWQKAFAVNGLGVRNLAIAANERDALFVHFSSDYVFEGLSKRPYTIVDTPKPISRYGESKLLGEQCIRDISNRFLLIRTSWVFGSGNENFPKKILAWSKKQKELKVVTDQVASPTYTVDLAKATLDLIQKETYGIYHITNSNHCSRYEWAEYILEQTGWQGTLIPVRSAEFNTPAQRPPFSVLDNFGIYELLGYTLPDWKDATSRFLKEMEMLS
jgi:dTDP-4-dehydrorhamnose reductase